ncbi:MAG: FG-GAP-like repeat-containing protein, partial [bacterium]
MTTKDTSYISSTIIDGNQNNSVVIFNNGETAAAVLFGFTIQNGNVLAGGGIYCNGSSPNLLNLSIRGNTVTGSGGGIYCQNSSLSLKNVTVSGNWSENEGGGIYCFNSSPGLENVTIRGNVAPYGGGICCGESRPSLINATISGNVADNGGGIFCSSNSNLSLVNTILWNNLSQEIYLHEAFNPSSITITHSNVHGGQNNIVTNDNGTVNWGDGNIDTDPLFVDATNNDYHLSNYSPCIGTGTDSIQIDGTWYYAPTTDINGNPRPNPAGSRPDMGAYESPRSAPLPPDAPTNLTVSSGNTQLTLSWTASTAPSVDKYYIYRSTTQGFTPSGVADTIASVDDSIPTFTDFNLTNGTTYYYRVSAVDGLGNESDYSEEASGTPSPVMLTVKKDGTGDFALIQAAIDASAHGDTVIVYPSTYVENINFNGKEIVVKSKDGANVTTIDGNQKDAVVTCNSGETHNSVLKGFTIKNGYRGIGGGIFCFYGSPSLIDLIIKNNTAECHGGGISCHQSSPLIFNVLIAENYSSIDDGGGIWLTSDSNPVLNNVSIVYNHAVTRGGGILCKDGSHPSVINSIIWGNTTPEILFYDEDGYAPNSINICYSLIFGGQDSIITNGIGVVNYGDGNIDTNPLFINSSSHNYHILDYSPCISAGTDSVQIDGIWYYAPKADLDNNPRPNPAGSRPDIGAYENALGGVQPAVVSLSSDSIKFKSVGVGKTDTLELTIYNTSLASELTISDIQSSNSVFTVSQSNFVIPADNSAIVDVYFTPDDFINYSDSLTIISDAANKPIAIIYLSAEGKIIVSHTPTQNALNVPKNTDISVTFGVDMNSATINSNTFIAHASQTGLHAGVYSYNAGTKTATFDPENNFVVGENVTVTLTTDIQTTTGDPLPNPYEWSFTIEVDGGSGVFAAKTDYTAGSRPHSVFSSDLDGDGDMDLAVANKNSANVSVLLNNGDGIFQSKTDYASGDGPISIFAIDLDGDGDMDLAVANNNSDNISVLLNNGNGTYSPKTDYTAGDGPHSVFSSDLDGDGDMDLAVANYNSNNVSVLLNNGNGTFSPKTDFTAGNGPYSVFSSDLDGDGDMDLAVTNGGSGKVSVLLNKGDGTFDVKIEYTVGSLPMSVFSADLNGDDDMDLAVANHWSHNVSVLINNGDGTFGAKTDYETGNNPNSIFSSDLDGDGDMDLAVADAGSGNVSVLLNNGDGTFCEKKQYIVGNGPYSIFSSDLDGDRDMDLAVANYSSSNVSILLNRCKEANISLSSNSLSFGGVKIDSTKSMQFTIYNNGVDSTLSISDIASSNPSFGPSPSSGTIL